MIDVGRCVRRMCVELGVINVGVEFGDCGDHLRDRLWGLACKSVASRNGSDEFRHIVRGSAWRRETHRIQAMSVVCRHVIPHTHAPRSTFEDGSLPSNSFDLSSVLHSPGAV